MLHFKISVIIFVVATTLMGVSSACPAGCICRGSPAQRDTAVCYKQWADRDRPVKFDEPITSIEFRHLLYQDVEPYLSAVRRVSNLIIYPPKTPPRDNPLPEDIFYGMDKLETLTIHPTADRLAPPGLARAMMPLNYLKSINLVGNTMQCDCALPDILASRNILVLAKNRMPAVKGCKQRGFPSNIYNINDFLKKCAGRGGYKLIEPSKAKTPVKQVGVTNRYFGNVRDQTLFNKGIKYSRINSSPMKPKGAKSSPGAFRGALGKPPSTNRGSFRPGQKRVLLPGAISGRSRRPPSYSASQLAKLHTKNSKPKSGKWGRRRLLSFDEADADPAPLETIELPRDETIRVRREGATPVKATNGRRMTMTEFINAHKRRGRWRKRRRKRNNNGWTRLSGGWRMKTIEPRSKREAVDEDNINLPEELIQPNQTEITEGAPNQGIVGNVEQENQVEQLNDVIPLQPRVDVASNRRPHDRRHHNSAGERARQLAMYQLPMNDLTVKLNPFDPFEVDLFFQYILHKEGSPGHYRPPAHP